MTMLTIRQVAQRMSVSADLVRTWIRRNELPGVVVSASRGCRRLCYRVAPEDLATFVANRQVRQPTARSRRRPDYERIV